MKLVTKSASSTLFLLGIISIFLSSCKDKVENDQDHVSKRLLLLKVDYLTHDFEGGQQLEMGAYNNMSDTLPLIVNYIAPSDFGSLSVYYNTTSSTSLVFEGSTVWMGLGSRTFPSTLIDSADFPKSVSPLPNIDSTEFNVVFYDLSPQEIHYDSIWDGIKNLEIVEFYRSAALTKMSLFLYRPSDGAGDPADWDWYIVMEK